MLFRLQSGGITQFATNMHHNISAISGLKSGLSKSLAVSEPKYSPLYEWQLNPGAVIRKINFTLHLQCLFVCLFSSTIKSVSEKRLPTEWFNEQQLKCLDGISQQPATPHLLLLFDWQALVGEYRYLFFDGGWVYVKSSRDEKSPISDLLRERELSQT